MSTPESSLKEGYFRERDRLLANTGLIEAAEKQYMQHLLSIVESAVKEMHEDFTESAYALLPFWLNYPPEQRGNYASGKATPMLELGEKLTSSHLLRSISNYFDDVTFPGLPTGGDVRFATHDALVHLDIKVSGPTESPNDLVVPPNQVSGDGVNYNDLGVLNSTYPVVNRRSGSLNYNFHPKLPPFYLLRGQTLLCLNFYLKVIYDVEGFGIQPLRYFEVACVPNGLLMFDGPRLVTFPNLTGAGKDEKSKAENTKRMRIYLNPLAQMHPWRAIKIERHESESAWRFFSRSQPKAKLLDLFE